MNDRFWAKVLFKEFIRHYRKLDDSQIVADVRKSMDDLEDLVDDADSFGSKMVRWSMERVDARPAEASRENGKKGGRPKKIPQDAPNGNAGVDMTDAGNGAASKSPTSCDQFTADGDIREGSQAKHDGSAITRNETRANDALGPSANHYATRQAKNGDAATREGAEAAYSRESGDSEPTTVSRNMRRVPQNEAPAHGFSGGRTAQGTMSRSPEAAAQSGKDYDQVPDADKHKQGDDNTADTAPDRGPESGKHSGKPNPSISTNDPASTAPSHGGSVASLEDRQGQALESQGRTGSSSVRGMAKVAQPPVRSFGEYGLVHLTDTQADKLRTYYGADFDRAVGILENYMLGLPSKADGDEKGGSKCWREEYSKRNHYYVMRKDNWVDSALKRAKIEDARLEKAASTPKSFKQMDADDRTEFFSKSIFDKEAV